MSERQLERRRIGTRPSGVALIILGGALTLAVVLLTFHLDRTELKLELRWRGRHDYPLASALGRAQRERKLLFGFSDRIQEDPGLTRSSRLPPSSPAPPSAAPQFQPTDGPSWHPTFHPTEEALDSPSPTPPPTLAPSIPPSDAKSDPPTSEPTTSFPSPTPSQAPTDWPSPAPASSNLPGHGSGNGLMDKPSLGTWLQRTANPTVGPSASPHSAAPTFFPTLAAAPVSAIPFTPFSTSSVIPTTEQTENTDTPTEQPTIQPTITPTQEPTMETSWHPASTITSEMPTVPVPVLWGPTQQPNQLSVPESPTVCVGNQTEELEHIYVYFEQFNTTLAPDHLLEQAFFEAYVNGSHVVQCAATLLSVKRVPDPIAADEVASTTSVGRTHQRQFTYGSALVLTERIEFRVTSKQYDRSGLFPTPVMSGVFVGGLLQFFAARHLPIYAIGIKDAPIPAPTAVPITSQSSYPSFAPTVHVPPTITPHTDSPSSTPTVPPVPSPTQSPTDRPSPDPTASPTVVPPATQVPAPTSDSFPRFTGHPSMLWAPTTAPSSLMAPLARPPSGMPTTESTSDPPSDARTQVPSNDPSAAPSSSSPSNKPSVLPSGSPSHRPSPRPTGPPSTSPTNFPSKRPTSIPTRRPPSAPPTEPSRPPTVKPAKSPTYNPSSSVPSSSPVEAQDQNAEPTVADAGSAPIGIPPVQQGTSPSSNGPSSTLTAEPTVSSNPSSFPSPFLTSRPSESPSFLRLLPQPDYKLHNLELNAIQMILTGVSLLPSRSQVVWADETEEAISREVVVVLNNQLESIDVRVDIVSQNPQQAASRDLQGAAADSPGTISSNLTIVFNVQLSVRAVVEEHNVRRYVGAALDSPSDQDKFISELKSSGEATFRDLKSVSIVLPSDNTGNLGSLGSMTTASDQGALGTGMTVGIAAVGIASVALLIVGVFMWANHRPEHSQVSSSAEQRLGSVDDDEDADVDVTFNIVDKPEVDVSTLGDPIPQGISVSPMDASIAEDTTSLPYDFKVASHALPSLDESNSFSYSEAGSNVMSVQTDDETLDAQYVSEDRIEVDAPPGMLGLVLEEDSEGIASVYDMKELSPLAEKVQIGDKLVSVDDVDVSAMPVQLVMKLIASKQSKQVRRLVFSRPTKKNGH